MDVLLLLYGFAFLSLGLTIVLRNERGSPLAIARMFWLLAVFGFVHGFHEWIDLWRWGHGDPPVVAQVASVTLFVSFLFLFEFGRRLVRSASAGSSFEGPISRVLGPLVYVPLLLGAGVSMSATTAPFGALAAYARLIPGFFGACLAGIGCHLYRRNRIGTEEDTTGSMSAYQMAWHVAAASFVAYGVFGGLIGAPPVTLISEDSFQQVVGVPVQVPRALCAVLIALSVGHLLRIFELERRYKMRSAFDARHYALERFYDVKARYESILDATTEGVVGLGEDGRALFANDKALVMLGYRREEILGQPFHALCHHTQASGQSHGPAECPIHRTMHDRIPRHVDEDVFWRKNSTWFPVAFRVVPMQRGKSDTGAVVAFRDLG